MKYLLITITITILFFSCKATKIQDPRNKTFRTVKVQEVKLKKSKLPKQYRYNELSKREKKLRSYKNVHIVYGTCPAYNYEAPAKHLRKLSKKLNPEYCNHIGPMKARRVMKSF